MLVKNRKVQYYFILMLFFFHFELAHSSAQSGDTLIYYVATNGNDSWSGLLANPTIKRDDGPFATLEKARKIIASKINSSEAAKQPINVQIREGIYIFDTTFRLAFPFSGTFSAPILFSSYPGEKVSIVGGVKISGFQHISDTSVLKKIPHLYHDSILQIDLKTLGITNYGALMPRGFPRPFYPSALELFFNNEPMQLARWPNEGWATIAATNGKNRFVYSGNRPARWQNSKDVWLHGFWGRDWADSHVAIKQIDTTEKIIITHEPHGTYGYKKGGRYYALNVLEELDVPGEWYLNRDTGILYFWPPSPHQEAEIYISLQETPLIELDSTAYIHFHDLTFEITRGVAFLIKNGENNTISKSIIRNIGKHAVDISDGHDNRVIGCDIYNTGAGGIRMSGGDREQLISAHNSAINNHIYHYNRWVKTYRPAIDLKGVGHIVRQNLIHDAPHFAIRIHGNEHIIELNEIFRVGQETGDASAFYMGRDWTMRGNVVRHNYFHHLKSNFKLGIMGVYLDDGASGLSIEGNIFYDVQRAILIGGGRDNLVENNVFLDCGLAVYMDGRVMLWKDLDKTLFKRLQNVPYQEKIWKEKYPTLASILENEPNCPQGNIISNNISINTKWINSRKETTAFKQMTGNTSLKKNKIINAKTLSINQKVLSKLNLQIPADKIGLQNTDMRASWPNLPAIRLPDKK